jgi:hypothetical protein
MQREHHHRYYRRLQEALDISRLYREVRDEVTEMHDYLQMKRTAHLQVLAEAQARETEAHRRQLEEAVAEEGRRDHRLEKRISLIGLLVGAPVLTIGFLGINLAGLTTGDGLPTGKALLIIGGVSAFLIGLVVLIVRVSGSKRGDGRG